MIHSIAWHTDAHYGLYTPGDGTFTRSTPPATSDEMLSIIGRPVKYFSRMTPETKSCLTAASVALRSLAPETAAKEVGLVAAGNDGCVKADQNYFRDYVREGRSMGRGNLFIYTLPTSTLGEVAIALSLNGPSMFLHADSAPIQSLVHQAEQLLADGEAGVMLALWSDSQAAVCMTVTLPNTPDPFDVPELSPRQVAEHFHRKATPA